MESFGMRYMGEIRGIGLIEGQKAVSNHATFAVYAKGVRDASVHHPAFIGPERLGPEAERVPGRVQHDPQARKVTAVRLW
jgi:hypothetical protein